MPELKACFEAAGFGSVRTVMSSGNVVFDVAEPDPARLESLAEQAMVQQLGRSFYTIVRSRDELQALLASDPFAEHGIPPQAQRVVSFFRASAQPRVALPLARDMASVFLARGREAFTAYVPNEQGPIFMSLIEQAFGKDVTTRTLGTLRKCLAA